MDTAVEEPRRAEGTWRAPRSLYLSGCLLFRSLSVSLSESESQVLSLSLSASQFLFDSLSRL